MNNPLRTEAMFAADKLRGSIVLAGNTIDDFSARHGRSLDLTSAQEQMAVALTWLEHLESVIADMTQDQAEDDDGGAR